MVARATLRVPAMNKWEAEWAQVLDLRRRAGQVHAYWYEGVTLRLGHDARYTPDFLVILTDGTVELHEVKGFMREAAHARLHVCARLYPFPIKLIRRSGGAWKVEDVPV